MHHHGLNGNATPSHGTHTHLWRELYYKLPPSAAVPRQRVMNRSFRQPSSDSEAITDGLSDRWFKQCGQRALSNSKSIRFLLFLRLTGQFTTRFCFDNMTKSRNQVKNLIKLTQLIEIGFYLPWPSAQPTSSPTVFRLRFLILII